MIVFFFYYSVTFAIEGQTQGLGHCPWRDSNPDLMKASELEPNTITIGPQTQHRYDQMYNIWVCLASSASTLAKIIPTYYNIMIKFQ